MGTLAPPRPPARRAPARRTAARRPPPRRAAAPAPTFAAVVALVVAGCSAALARARSQRRLTRFLACQLVLTLVLAVRLVSIQVVSAQEYRGLAAAQTQRELELPPRRGKLYDRGGEPLALSLSAATVYANPRVLADNGIDPREVALPLARLLERPVDELVALLAKDAGFVYLARQVPRQVGEQVSAMTLPGVAVLEEPTRVYPAQGLAAQVLGFAGIDNEGLYGLERQYDDLLAGRPGRLRLERAPGGLDIAAAPREALPPVPGADLVLTIDRQIQHAAERALAGALERYEAIGGSAVVLDGRSGEILAMASAPGFEAAAIGAADDYARRNRAVTDVYEPGSVNKVITAAAALQEGVITPQTVITVPDRYQVGPKRFSDAHRHDPEAMTLAEIIAESSNIGTIKIAEQLGAAQLDAYVRRFGYGRTSGLAFPGESAGLLPALKDWSGTSLPTIAIGQGVSATLLQVAGVYQTIAAGGVATAPTLVRGEVGPDGRLDARPDPPRERIVDADVAATVARMLAGVVESEDGTGRLAAVPGYRVGGKTGTAQKPSTTRRGYEPGAYIASFAGFAPIEDPALVVAVMLDEPEPYYGGVSAAPVFAEILEFALRHRRVPPSDPAARTQPQIAVAPTPVAPTPAAP
jgi:cell division protein FtsI (penicillin-binding protein 3)